MSAFSVCQLSPSPAVSSPICNKMDDLVEMEAITWVPCKSLHKYTVFILRIPVSLVNLLSPPV